MTNYHLSPLDRFSGGCSNKHRRTGKPWWSEDLTLAWNNVCIKEKLWLRCNYSNGKKALKSMYVSERKHFDRLVQRAKRMYWFKCQVDLLETVDNNPNEFWKSIGKVGIVQDKRKCIPMEVVLDDGTVSNNLQTVMNKWKHDFSSLLNVNHSDQFGVHPDINAHANVDPILSDDISLLEVRQAVTRAKRGKACGPDGIPSDVLRNDISVSFLHVLFNICLHSGKVPAQWGMGTINPIPKSSTLDSRDPLSYRGITLASVLYKLYASILNERLSKWVETNDKLTDDQNGFRKKRSTVDHLSTLTTIIETRKKKRLSTFCAFIDFKKAYDCIDRNILWKKLSNSGINGRILNAVKSLYSNVSSSVRLNGRLTDWFDVTSGLRQGCSLSPLLFNLFINDLALQVSALGKGIPIGNERVAILMYADDVVIMAENETDLQYMLDRLGNWCQANNMRINADKSKVVHFRYRALRRTEALFRCGDHEIAVIDSYKYLGLILDEFLDFNITAKMVAQSASRALGLLIAKFKRMGGMPYTVFSKLYDNLVWPIIAYGAAVWGTTRFSCIDAVQNRAMRFFLGTGKYTPSAGVAGDMGWQPPSVKQWKCIGLHWCRLSNMENARRNKRVFIWGLSQGNTRCNNWCHAVKTKLNSLDLIHYTDALNPVPKNSLIRDINDRLMETFVATEWLPTVNRIVSARGNGGSKLRRYKLVKDTWGVESYCTMLLPRTHRSAFAKFRCGVAPLRLETGRYEQLPINDRRCPFCPSQVEDEYHALFNCSVYSDLRTTLYEKACFIEPLFANMTEDAKFVFLFSNSHIIRVCAKTLYCILNRRSALLYK